MVSMASWYRADLGVRGIEGKIAAVRLARENRIPFLGLCLGLQCAVIEFARARLGIPMRAPGEFDPPHTAPRDRSHGLITNSGRPRRNHAARLVRSPPRPRLSFAAALREELIYERHRHRYG